jgi:hypothetical protein
MSNSLCLTCEKTFEKSDDTFFSKAATEIPLWYKEIGNYSLLPPPINRNPKLNPFINKLEKYCPINYDISINIDINKLIPNLNNTKSRWIYYWASKTRNYMDIEYSYAADAYNDFSNSGLTQTNKKGIAKLKVRNPVLYHVENQGYPPHIHFTYLDNNNTWSDTSFAIVITPEIDYNVFDKLRQSGKYIVINASNNYNSLSIPNTYHIPSNINSNIDANIRKITIDNYTKLKKLLRRTLNLQELPIIVYSNNKESNASDELVKKLRKAGYINLIIYRNGSKEWNKFN